MNVYLSYLKSLPHPFFRIFFRYLEQFICTKKNFFSEDNEYHETFSYIIVSVCNNEDVIKREILQKMSAKRKSDKKYIEAYPSAKLFSDDDTERNIKLTILLFT